LNNTEQLPGSRDAFERVFARGLEVVARSGGRDRNRRSREHLTRARESHNPRGDVNAYARQIVGATFDVTNVDTDPNRQIIISELSLNALDSEQSSAGRRERREHPITRLFHDPATMLRDDACDFSVVTLNCVLPQLVTERGRAFGRSDEIREHDGTQFALG